MIKMSRQSGLLRSFSSLQHEVEDKWKLRVWRILRQLDHHSEDIWGLPYVCEILVLRSMFAESLPTLLTIFPVPHRLAPK